MCRELAGGVDPGLWLAWEGSSSKRNKRPGGGLLEDGRVGAGTAEVSRECRKGETLRGRWGWDGTWVAWDATAAPVGKAGNGNKGPGR